MKRLCLFVTCVFFVCGIALRLNAAETAVTQKEKAAAKPAQTQVNEPKKESTPKPATQPATKPETSQDMSVLPAKDGAAAEPPKTQMYELDTQATLKAVPKSDTTLEMHLSNKGPINGLQFTLTGVSITSVRTTSRTAAFMAKFNAASGKVLMVSVSQTPIPPGDGPILEVVGEKARTASLSDVKLIKSNAPKM